MDDLFLAVFRRGAQANLERQTRALASSQPLRALWEISVDPDAMPPVAVAVLMASISRVLVMESALGITTGHQEMIALVDRYLRRFEA